MDRPLLWPSSRMRTSLLLVSLLIALTAPAQQLHDLIVPRSAAPAVIVPVNGNAQGAGGTYFRSDINVINLRNAAQRVALYWLPQGQSGSLTVPVRTIEMNALSGFSSEDFVGEILDRQGLGAIHFVAVQPSGALDTGGLLHVTSRIWTPRPDGAAGTMSQTFPAIIRGETVPATLRIVFGLRRSTQYRLNAGVMNPATTTQRFRVTASISGAGGTDSQVMEFDVPPLSIHQQLVPGTSAGTVQVLIENLTGTAGEWHGWGSSVDNQSGDAWSQIAFGGGQ